MSNALGQCPSEWIVNSNALGVAFLSAADEFRVGFLSRHAVRRLADGTLLGKTAEELLGSAAIELADVPELKMTSLRDQANYPTTASTIVGEQHIELAISPVMSGDQSYLGVMVTFRDVTEQARQHEQSVQFESAIAGHAGRGREEADRAEQVAESVGTTVSALQGNGAQMAELVGRLQTLNGQTRMLSLNASIEATRAGEAGQAFRVIADEVGQLSQQVGEVTAEVHGILRSMDTDSAAASTSVANVVESVAALVAVQRAMEEEIRQRG